MKKLIYFYIFLSIPSIFCIFWDATHNSLFAMAEKVEEPRKIENIEEIQAKKQEEELLQAEKELLQQQQKQKQLIMHQKQFIQDSQKTVTSGPSSEKTIGILVPEKSQKIVKKEKEETAQILAKKLTAELEALQTKVKPIKKETVSPLSICIKNITMEQIAESKEIIENKDNENIFNELSDSLEKLTRYEAKKFSSDYYDMTTSDIQEKRNTILNTNPNNKDYDPTYRDLIVQEQMIRAKINALLQKKTNKPGMIDTIINGCVNRTIITIIKKEQEAVESILSN